MTKTTTGPKTRGRGAAKAAKATGRTPRGAQAQANNGNGTVEAGANEAAFLKQNKKQVAWLKKSLAATMKTRESVNESLIATDALIEDMQARINTYEHA